MPALRSGLPLRSSLEHSASPSLYLAWQAATDRPELTAASGPRLGSSAYLLKVVEVRPNGVMGRFMLRTTHESVKDRNWHGHRLDMSDGHNGGPPGGPGASRRLRATALRATPCAQLPSQPKPEENKSTEKFGLD